MTKEEILKRVKKFQGANREFSQELPPIIEGLVDLIDEAGPEVVNNLTSNSPTKALSANMGKELKLMVDGKVSEPETAGTAGQILQLDEEGVPEWVDAAEVGATYDSAVSDTSTNAIQNKTIKKYVDDNFAQKDGYYASLTAGAAENIVGQSAIEGTFLLRTTADDADVSNGVATIEVVKGNSVAWNQVVDNTASTTTHNGITYTKNSDGSYSVSGTAGPDGSWCFVSSIFTQISGHKYLIKGGNTNVKVGGYMIAGLSTHNTDVIVTASSSGEQRIAIVVDSNVAIPTAVKVFAQCIDLTLMGIDNLTTVAQVESWLAANVGSKPYYPASSKLLPTKLLKYVSRGFNQWDEDWRVGYYNQNGAFLPGGNNIANKNFIPVFPNTSYYYKGDKGNVILYYDEGQNYISQQIFEVANVSHLFTTPANAHFINFYTWGISTYNHDICINLSWDGSRNGEYEPSEIHEYNLDVTKFYGKLNGEGDLTQIFPGGMRKADYAGTVRDLLSLKDAEADVKVGSVDLGTLDWLYSTGGGGHFLRNLSQIEDFKTNASYDTSPANMVCAKYENTNYQDVWYNRKDKIISSYEAQKRLAVVDNSITASDVVDGVVAKLAGVMLNYELATPRHYTDLVYRDNGVDTPVEALNVIVNNWSTEEEIIAAPEESGDPNSCAATLDILYGIDAAEQLDTINQSGIFTGDLKDNLSALIGVINTNCATALGGTLSISENPTEKVYTFTFTPSTPESQGD